MDTLGLTEKEFRFLKTLNSPERVQDFLDSLPINFELSGETYRSVKRTLHAGEAHCFEGALVAASALWLQGERPLLLDLKTDGDDDHLVTIFKREGYFGAISKTNHLALRYRDPIYRSIRELALSYFQDYFRTDGRKTLRGYAAFSLRRYPPRAWISADEELTSIVEDIEVARHWPLLPKRLEKRLRKADPVVRIVSEATEWNRRKIRARLAPPV